MRKLALQDLELRGKKVLVRVDFNVPLDEKGGIADDTRIRAALPTIRYIANNGAKVILISHLGTPKEKEERLRMDVISKRLQELIGQRVVKIDDCIGKEVEKAISQIKEGEIILLENVRFYKEETENNEDFSRKLAALYDLFINDAFATAHRAHASTVGVTRFLPSASGLLLQKEIETLEEALKCPKRPLVAILGGAKIFTKMRILEHLLDKVDVFLIGGVLSYTFIKAQGQEVGNSMVEEEMFSLSQELIEKVNRRKITFCLPLDHIIAQEVTPDAQTKTVKRGCIPSNWEGVDIGPETVNEYVKFIRQAGTIIWNGPMGAFEIEPFSKGTVAIAKEVAATKAMSVVGGGDLIACFRKTGLDKKITYLSTGGGAMLTYLEGEGLPAIDALTDKIEA